MTNKTIAAPAAECPCTPVTPVQFLTGNEAVKHLELLLAYMESPLAATKEMVSAYYQKARGYYVHNCRMKAMKAGFDDCVDDLAFKAI